MLTPEQLRTSLHLLREVCDAQTRVPGVVGSIIEWFNVLLENTLLAAPLRGESIRGDDPCGLCRRPDTSFGSHSHIEHRLERSLWEQWPVGRTDGERFFPDCDGFVNYQVPLYDGADRNGWGAIDLVGRSPTGRPQVWELKKPGGDNPFMMVLEGLAYGVALRRAWNRGRFAAEWGSKVLGGVADHTIHTVEVFGVAPTEYWAGAHRDWLNTAERRAALAELMACAARAGFPVRLVSFEAEPTSVSPFFKTEQGREVAL